MRILFYGEAAARIGREAALAAPSDVGALRRALADSHPGAGAALLSPRWRAFVGDSAVDDGFALREDMTVEFLPPVSGG